jgi:hypothetical protein
MPLGAPNIVSPVTQCSERVRVQGQFTNSRVRIFVEGDPTPIGDQVVPWSDVHVDVDRTRLVVGRKLVATQEIGGELSPPSPKGQVIRAAQNGLVLFATPPHVCGRSVLLLDCSPGAEIGVWQGTTLLGSEKAVGELCRVDFTPGLSIVSGGTLKASQRICTSPTPVDTISAVPVMPPTVPFRKLAPPVIDRPIKECERLITARQIVPGAVLRIFRGGGVIFERPCPIDVQSVFVGSGFNPGEEIAAEQEMPNCEIRSERDSLGVLPLEGLEKPRVDGPLCAGPSEVTISRLKPGATVRVFADGTEIGRWEASDTSLPLDLDVPGTAVLTAQQELCGKVSPLSRGYSVARDRSGRWFVVEDSVGNNLKAEAFGIHAALVRTGQIVLFSGDQFNKAQNESRPQDIDHTQLFDCEALTLQNIDSPQSDVFCAGHAFLADGRLVVAGGTEKFPESGGPHHQHYPGLPTTWLFDPTPPSGQAHWTQVQDMAGGRWYPTLVTLRDGRVLALSGHPANSDTRHNNSTLEVLDPGAGPSWLSFGDSAEILSSDPHDSPFLYPRLYILPGGDVFSATPLPPTVLTGQSARWSPGSGTTWNGVTSAPPGYDEWSTTSVMLPLLPEDDYHVRIVVTGGEKAYVIDFGTPAAPTLNQTWNELGPRSSASGGRVRNNGNAVILPTAEVFFCGGVEGELDNTSVFDPEMLVRTSPNQWKWDAVPFARSTVVRNYHSTALLMPDGRVWTAGSSINHFSGGPAVRRLEVEIYEPWYTCAARPVIRAWPGSAHAGQRIIVRVKSPQPIERLAILRAGSVTHAFNTDQRYVGLSNVKPLENDEYSGEIPSSDIAIPGYYLLYACTGGNIPSKGVFIQVLP